MAEGSYLFDHFDDGGLGGDQLLVLQLVVQGGKAVLDLRFTRPQRVDFGVFPL